MTKNNRTLLHCSLIKDIGPAKIQKVLLDQELQQDFSALYSFRAHDFKKRYNFSETIAHPIVVGLSDEAVLENECALLEKHSIDWISFFDDEYPALLKEIHLPPLGLYFKGAPLKNYDHCLSIVGSRKAGPYAEMVVDLFVPELVQKGWAIVSGGALGADCMAHAATLAAHGRTAVVLGSGLLKPYPEDNIKLFQSIVESGGTLISSFPLETPPLQGNFPARNRIIAGLSKGCIVVQAAKRSGASITANFALEQGREVFAVPGRIDNPLSAGCHKLIAQGAKLVGSVDDIIEEFETAFIPVAKLQKNIFTPAKKTEFSDPLVSLCETPMGIDELCQKTDSTSSEMQEKLFNLQLDGKVRQNFAGMWERV